ncbi:MAG: glycosyltransferase [bacterium]
MAKKLAPAGSIRRRFLKSSWRMMMLVRGHGPIAWLRRSLSRAKSKLIQEIQYFLAGRKSFESNDFPVILAISHVGGGGTERHVHDMAQRLFSEGVRPIYARPDASGRLIFEERDDLWKLKWRRVIRPDTDDIQAILNQINPSLVHVHHTMGVPRQLFDIINKQQIATDWTLHDYHAMCPRIHLHDDTGRYCGEPDPSGCNSCLKRLGNYHGDPVSTTIENYRREWAEQLSHARAIYVPSDDARQRLSRYFPKLKIQSRPHMEPSSPDSLLALKFNNGESVRVAVIGSIGSIKGSAPLLAAAQDAAARQLPIEFVLVGTSNLEPQLLATGRVELTGPYFEHEVWKRLEEAACHLAWLPSIWPETYMYTLSVAQLAGFWPMVYNMGAQGRRVLDSGYGDCISIDMPADELNDLLLKRAAQLADHDFPGVPQFAEYPDFLVDYYGLTYDQLKSMGERNQTDTRQAVLNHPHLNSNITPHESRSDHARLYEHHRQLSA